MLCTVGEVAKMALPQIVTKTYSRRRSRQADVSHAERTFDELFRGASRPPARAAATAEKWGSASFKRVCNTTRTSPKRRLSPTRDADDPFSFDSDDDNLAKKSRKENVRQKTSARKQNVDGDSSATEKSRSRLMNLKEKSSADGVVDKRRMTSGDDERRAKQFIEKVTVCQPAAKSDDSERNGLSVYCMSAATMSGRGDSVESNERKCQRSNGLETTSCAEKKSSCSPTSGRNTRSSGTPSPCKTTEQLKVFVDNFSQLISSQRSASSRRCQPDSNVSSRTLSSAARLDSAVKKSKSSENCNSDAGHSPLLILTRVACDGRQPVSSVKTETALSSAVHHSKQLHEHFDDDDDGDDGSVILLSPDRLYSGRPSDTDTTSSGTCSLDITNSRNSSPSKTTSRISKPRDISRLKCTGSSGNNKNEAVSSKSGHLRSHRWRTHATDGSADSEPPTATTAAAAAATTTTSTRRLLTGSQKVSSFTLLCIKY